MSRGPDLSAAAFERRRTDFPEAPSPIARNYAAAELGDGSIATARSRGASSHAELDLLRQAEAGGSSIVALYSERQPCCACEAALGAGGVPPEAVAYSVEFFDLEGERTLEDEAELSRLNNGVFESLRQMVREAEGPRRRSLPAGRAAALVAETTARLHEPGWSILTEPDLGGEPGVELVVDDLPDSAGGLYLSWYVGADLAARVVDAVHGDRFEDPALTEAAAVKQRRLADMAAVLDKAGIQAVPVTDGTSPYTLHLPL